MSQFALLLVPFSCISFFINEVDSHNKSRQSDLALENFYVTQCGWLRLCTTVDMRMSINNCWKLFWYGVKRDHHDKFIFIRELLERITVACFNNTFTTAKETLEKNTPSIYDIDTVVTGSTFRRLRYPSSSLRNSEISTISDITITTSWFTAIGHTAPKEVEL